MSDMDKYNNDSEISEENRSTEVSDADRGNASVKDTEHEKPNDGYEEICYICHRPESVAGKMIHIPNNICICRDCMQRTFDSMSN